MNVKPFLAPYRNCQKKINDCIINCKKKDVVSLMTHSQKVIISKFVSEICGTNIDSDGNVYFADELDPEIVSDYIYENKSHLGLSRDILYKYVCIILQRRTKELYYYCRRKEDNEVGVLSEIYLTKHTKKDIKRYCDELMIKYADRKEFLKTSHRDRLNV